MKISRWALLGLFFCAFFNFTACSVKTKQFKTAQSIPTVEVESVSYRTFIDEIRSSGILKGSSQLPVFPKAPGKLLSYCVSEGSLVRKGDVIAKLDRDITGFKYQPLKVVSPIKAVVLELPLDRGMSVSPNRAIAYVADIKIMELDLYISEKDLSKVKVGDKVKVMADAIPKKIFWGQVKSISYKVDPITHTARVKIFLPNDNSVLLPGMFVRAVIICGKDKFLSVDRDALLRLPATNVTYCFVVKNGKVQRHIVTTGIANGRYLQVLRGLKLGDAVVVSGQGVLKDGMRVKVKQGTKSEAIK